MKYDAENNKIMLSCREFIRTARRAIATVAPYDNDEPELRPVSKRLLKEAIGDFKRVSLIWGFEEAGYPIEITAEAEKICGDDMWFCCEVDTNPSRPRKECVSQLRGEAYIAALAYAKTNDRERVKLNFVYINSETLAFAKSFESVTLKKLERFFEKCAVTVRIYAKPEIDRVTVRVPSMKGLKFPYKIIRAGQSEFVQRAYKSIARGGTLFATAPTGTGKTVSALYPAVRAMGDGRRDKTFYLTPKETTAIAAVECLELMAKSGAVIRAVKLSAKEKRCKNGLLCRDSRELCENSKFNKLADATLALYKKEKAVVTADDIDLTAREFKVCPYELSLTYSELCDVVICDFNYLFDPAVYIRRFFSDGGNYAFLIDEAHNLPDRAREMYSAEISEDDILLPAISKVLGEFSSVKKLSRVAASALRESLFPVIKEEIRTNADGAKYASAHLKEIPFELYEVFDSLSVSIEDEIFLNYSAKDGEKGQRIKFLRDYGYMIKKFRTVMQKFDSSYEMFIFYENDKIRTKLFCIDTGKEISERLEKGRAAVFFSATLTPLYYYKSLLGGDGTSDVLEVESPFDPSQLSVSIMDKISTRFSEREDTLSAVSRAIAATVSAKRGNYMIFSPSFAYSELLSKAFKARYPKINILTQKRNMTAKEKEAFLAEFEKQGKSYLIGFCVMGGIYSEGIDLVGDSLIGAVIIGIGMPGLSYEREAICAYYDEKYEEGKQFAYIYPGINRVLQAAGRVIRREDDKGVIILIDDRFDDPIYKKIIPSLWRGMKFIGDAKELRENLDSFWQKKTK